MRFIGNKELITSEIREVLDGACLSNKNLTLFDAFCGTGAVSDALKKSFNIVSNDMLTWCVIYTRGRVCASGCTFDKLGFDPFAYFNSNSESYFGFFYKNYSLGGSDRMYFSKENAARIDYFRTQIEEWNFEGLLNEDEYSYLLASLIESVSHVSNTAGVYGAFLKHWDSRSLKPIEFKKVAFNAEAFGAVDFLNSKVEDIISEVSCDILYLDPPYTQNQYGTQYHLLETLVLSDQPKISEITGSRSTSDLRSDWSKNYKSHILFDKIVAETKAKYILFSYSKDGFLSRSFIEAVLKRYGKPDTYICRKIKYKKYTNFKSRDDLEHFEYLFFVEKKPSSEVFYESPLNYMGSKAKMASFINSKIPSGVNTFVDAFGGGFNVGINVDAKNVTYNDSNNFVASLVSSFKFVDTYQYIMYIKRMIKKFDLSPEDNASYQEIRDYYNSFPVTKRDPRLLYTVILYGFNQQIRFNTNHEFNNPVGMRWFNDKVLEKLISFSRVMKESDIRFKSIDYRELFSDLESEDFIYLDPPYMLTTGSYNDGKRGFSGWSSNMEKDFLDFIDKLHSEGKRFMFSYVLGHKGQRNLQLESWMQKGSYKVFRVDPALGNNREEVLIVNY